MATSHGSLRWKLYGGGAEVAKLPNNRYAVTIRCQSHNLTKDWYYANLANLFKDFGSAYDLPLEDGDEASSSWTPDDGEEYPNLKLINIEYKYIPNMETPVLEFSYETLTGTWTNEDNNLNPLSVNGLRVLEQNQVAVGGTALPYDEDDIGVVTISDGGKTLYLAGINDRSSERKGQVTLSWAEAGTLSETVTPESTGLNRVSTTYLAVEPATSHPVITRTTQNVEGLKTITVVTFQRSDGGAITSTQPTNTYGDMEVFVYPGIVGVSSVTAKSVNNGVVVDNAINRFFYQQSPVERPIPVTKYVFFQTSSTPTAGDYTYDGALGLWSPSNYARGTYYGWRYQRDGFGTPIGESPGFRGFRTVEDDTEISGVVKSLSGTATDDDGLNGTLLLNGSTYSISVSGGPEKPDGNKYTLGTIDIKPAFIDVDGTQYYRKIITVATIPEQSGSTITS
jgi:hypothetical protein